MFHILEGLFLILTFKGVVIEFTIKSKINFKKPEHIKITFSIPLSRTIPREHSNITNANSVERHRARDGGIGVLMESSKHSFMQIAVDRLIRYVERALVDIIRVEFKCNSLLPVLSMWSGSIRFEERIESFN